MRDSLRWRRLLAAMWLGALLTVALIATPAAFATLARPEAGRVAARILASEAYLSLALAALLMLLERVAARSAAGSASDPALSSAMLLVLGAVFCTVAGYFAVLPLMEQARAGAGRLSLAQLHAVSSAFYALKVALVASLAWRLSRSPSSSG